MVHSTNFFEVDRDGLRKIATRRGYSWVLFELIQNSWDEQATRVSLAPTHRLQLSHEYSHQEET